MTMAQNQKPLNRSAWWALFALATFVMSLCFQAFKTFTLLPTLANGLLWLGAIALLVLLVAVLTYDSYVQEKSQGRVQRPIGLFEWMIEKRILLKGDEPR